MAATIRLITYNGQTVVPRTDGIIQDASIGQNGIFYGCEVTSSGNIINISGGYGIIKGRYFEIDASTVPITLATTDTLLGRLYIRLDLSNTESPIQILTETDSSLSPLEQNDDVNYVNGVWEMEMATFTVTTTEVTDVVETYETITDNGTLINTLNSNILDMFRIQTYSKANVSIPANDRVTASIAFSYPSGFTKLTILGVRIDSTNTSSSTNANYCFSSNYYPSGNELNANVRNTASSPAKVTVNIVVMFIRTSLT